MLKYRTITSPDINNGLGCRITIWISGCTHKCPGCHNQELWDYNEGNLLFREEVINKLYKELVTKPYIQGITLSGGDPLCQSSENINELNQFINTLKQKTYAYNKRKFDIWVYSGDVYENLIKTKNIKDVLDNCDVLVDGPYMQDLRDITIPFRGSSNQRLIDLNETKKQGKIIELKIIN